MMPDNLGNMRSRIRALYEEEASLRKDDLVKIYDGQAITVKDKIPFWAVYFLRLKQRWLEKILSKYINDNCSVLDLGCGPGYLSSKFANAASRVYGLDISFQYLKIAVNRHGAYDFVQGDALNLPFKDKSFDIVICSEVLEHLLSCETALEEIKRVTRKLFISTVPLIPRVLDRIRLNLQKDKIFSPGRGHIRSFQVGSYLNALIERGFRIKVVQGIGFFWWIFPWLTRDAGKKTESILQIDSFFSNLPVFRTFLLDLGVVSEL